MNTTHNKDWGASVRTIMQGLILAGVMWLASSVSRQNASIAAMQVQLADLKATFDGIPDLKDRVTKIETHQAEIIRRIDADQVLAHDLHGVAMGCWKAPTKPAHPARVQPSST